jgi:Kef-type K+ transport system membrane component KefB
MLAVVSVVAVLTKMIGCGLAALARGMGWVRSLRIGCGMISRGEVGLIIAAIAAKSGIFLPSEVALIVGVVLVTTLLTPFALRGAFRLHCADDDEDISGGLEDLTDQFATLAPIQRSPGSAPPHSMLSG